MYSCVDFPVRARSLRFRCILLMAKSAAAELVVKRGSSQWSSTPDFTRARNSSSREVLACADGCPGRPGRNRATNLPMPKCNAVMAYASAQQKRVDAPPSLCAPTRGGPTRRRSRNDIDARADVRGAGCIDCAAAVLMGRPINNEIARIEQSIIVIVL
jgi:hypothetical protein